MKAQSLRCFSCNSNYDVECSDPSVIMSEECTGNKTVCVTYEARDKSSGKLSFDQNELVIQT